MPRAKDPERFDIVLDAVRAGHTMGRDIVEHTGYRPTQVRGALKKLSDTGEIELDHWTSDPIKGARYKIRVWRIKDESKMDINKLLRSAW